MWGCFLSKGLLYLLHRKGNGSQLKGDNIMSKLTNEESTMNLKEVQKEFNISEERAIDFFDSIKAFF